MAYIRAIDNDETWHLTHGSSQPSIRLARQMAAAATTLGRYCRNVLPSSKLDSMRNWNDTRRRELVNVKIKHYIHYRTVMSIT